MLRDAEPGHFKDIYIVCGYTDLRYGIDSLAAILERKYHGSLLVPNTLFLFCDRSASKIKGLWSLKRHVFIGILTNPDPPRIRLVPPLLLYL